MPAIACDPESLLAASECIDQVIPAGRMPAVIAYLLAVIAGGPTDPQSLLAASNCIDKVIPAGMMQAVITALLCNINNGQTMNTNLLDAGIAPLSGGNATVPTSAASASNVILLTYYSLNFSLASVGYSTIVNGVSFRINSSNGEDTNLVSWAIFKP